MVNVTITIALIEIYYPSYKNCKTSLQLQLCLHFDYSHLIHSKCEKKNSFNWDLSPLSTWQLGIQMGLYYLIWLSGSFDTWKTGFETDSKTCPDLIMGPYRFQHVDPRLDIRAFDNTNYISKLRFFGTFLYIIIEVIDVLLWVEWYAYYKKKWKIKRN